MRVSIVGHGLFGDAFVMKFATVAGLEGAGWEAFLAGRERATATAADRSVRSTLGLGRGAHAGISFRTCEAFG
jgi:hypothetical protein